jgi:hypothetical protein
MTAISDDSANELKPRELRLDRLLGRQVLARNNRPVGRLEEFRAEKHGTGCVIPEFVIGTAGMLERLHVGLKLLFRGRGDGYVARWDQIDLSDTDHPRLLCPVEELRRL